MTDTGKSRIYLAMIVGLLLVIATMAYKFVIVGSTQKGDDKRVAVILEPGERALILQEMREHVVGLGLIAEALSRDDMPRVATASRAMGTARTDEVPAALMAKLPLAFKSLALSTHRDFDTIAADADAGGTPKHALSQLAGVLRTCAACHASYQVAGASHQ
jgi:hypothetical protein